MIRILGCLQEEWEDVGEIRTVWFLVDGALVEVRAAATVSINGKHVYDREHTVEHFGGGLQQLGIAAIPACAVKV